MTNEEQILDLLRENQELLQATFRSAEKTRKYILYTAIITILTIVVPAILLAVYLPSFINTYMGNLSGNNILQ
jgi:type II secretory pathway component PulF